MKFGGSSVSSPQNISKILEIIQRQDGTKVIVVSAFGGCTDKLLKLCEEALSGDYHAILEDIEYRHVQTIKDLIPIKFQSEILLKLRIQINHLHDLCSGVSLLKELSERTKARIIGFGEMASSMIIAEAGKQFDLDTILVPGQSLIHTDSNYLLGQVDFEQTHSNISKHFKDDGHTYLVPGFVAADKQGSTTTLGRGGSDYSAAIIAASLGASRLEVWSDVNGMLTANPKLVKNARTIEKLSYNEALELSHFGAKVLYPPTIQPVLQAKIPLILKNTFEPDQPGTYIFRKNDEESIKEIVGISSLQNITLLTISGLGMIGSSGYSKKVFTVLGRANINIVLISQSCSEFTICIGVLSDSREKALSALKESFNDEMLAGRINPIATNDELSIVALVGDNMQHHIGTSGKAFSILGENGINIKAIAQGSSERNISIVIDSKNEKKALNVLHEGFFADTRKTVHLFIVGVGNVGSQLMSILKDQFHHLFEDRKIEVRVAGLANSKKFVIDTQGLELEKWSDALSEGAEGTVHDFIDEMLEANARNSIFIDNTANAEVAKTYSRILDNSISVVACNKIALSANYADYQKLKSTSNHRNVEMRYETCVGAALPVISTIQDLVTSGDDIDSIEAVLSGSLNFIFNEYNGSKKFAEIVKQAKEEGYTEPDPLIDLGGLDVMRKILILAREVGETVELENVKSKPMIPKSCAEATSTNELFRELEKNESYFHEMYDKANNAGKKLKFVAEYKKGKSLSVGLREVGGNHPFFNLDGKDNIVAVKSARYPDQPLVIMGAGAGAEVTAGGVFSDVMRIINK